MEYFSNTEKYYAQIYMGVYKKADSIIGHSSTAYDSVCVYIYIYIYIYTHTHTHTHKV